MTSRKKPGVAFWATVGLVVVLVVYPLSFGPACWLGSRASSPPLLTVGLLFLYEPLARVVVLAPGDSAGRAMVSYAGLFGEDAAVFALFATAVSEWDGR